MGAMVYKTFSMVYVSFMASPDLGDANFGIFSMAYASVSGRLIAWRVGRGKSKTWLYLFTTWALPAQQIVEMYACRWNIETDLCSLKRTVRLHQLTAKSPEMTEKELLLAFSAYNLVRAVMCLAAQKAGLPPRQLSFSHVLNVVDAAWPQLSSPASLEEHHREFDRVLDRAAQCRLPQRRKMRSFSRAVWRHGLAFPYRNPPLRRPRKLNDIAHECPCHLSF